MKFVIVNKTKLRTPKKTVDFWVQEGFKSFKKQRVRLPNAQKELVIALISESEMTEMNRVYRGKKYATDILSFVSDDPTVFGELVICVATIKKQAKSHGLTFDQELGYMLLHGILHLAGFDHERGEKEATKMFKIQDDVFNKLCLKLRHVRSSRIVRTKKKTRIRA